MTDMISELTQELYIVNETLTAHKELFRQSQENFAGMKDISDQWKARCKDLEAQLQEAG